MDMRRVSKSLFVVGVVCGVCLVLAGLDQSVDGCQVCYEGCAFATYGYWDCEQGQFPGQGCVAWSSGCTPGVIIEGDPPTDPRPRPLGP